MKSFLLTLSLFLTIGCTTPRGVAEWGNRESFEGAFYNDPQMPYLPQGVDQCGPAALGMILGAKGSSQAYERLVEITMTPAFQGSSTLDLSGAARRMGWLPVSVVDLEEVIGLTVQGHSPLLLINIGHSLLPQWHYVVVTGFDSRTEMVRLRSGTFRQLEIPMEELSWRWSPESRWGIVILSPEESPSGTRRTAYLREAIALEKMGKIELAEGAYERAAQYWPLSLTAQMGLANTLARQGKWVGAEKVLRKAKKQFPLDPRVRHNLNLTVERLSELGLPSRG